MRPSARSIRSLVLLVAAACAVPPGGSTRRACRDLAEAWCARLTACTTEHDRALANQPLTYDACVAQWADTLGCAHTPLASLCGAAPDVDAIDGCAARLATGACDDASGPVCADVCPAPAAARVRIAWTLRDVGARAHTCAQSGGARVSVSARRDDEQRVALAACGDLEVDLPDVAAGRYRIDAVLVDGDERPLARASLDLEVEAPVTRAAVEFTVAP